MADERWQRVKELFQAAIECEPGDRPAFLNEACRGDPTLRAEVEALLGSDSETGDFLKPPLADGDLDVRAGEAADRLVGSQIGRYHLKRVIATGGMGTVYEAVQEHPRRTVAVKLMRSGIVSSSALRRFEYESQILASLRHPGIAQVYEAGAHDLGGGAVPYFAMEYVPNAKPVTDYARDKKLGTRQRLELFTQVCEAVHHGHQKGIIHRDLKPGNILVDSSGQVKIIDFGVARATDSDLAVTTMRTDVVQLIGTVQYMSPEQVEADPHDLDIRSDVYGLGVVLYELLCERLPYNVCKVALYEAARVIREQPPTRLSTVNRTLGGDIETIVLKALEKDRARRYQSAADLVRDIGHYLNDEPIEAKRDSGWYVLKKTIRRYRVLVAIIAAFVGLVAASSVALLFMYGKQGELLVEVSRQRAVAAEARYRAEEREQTAQRYLYAAHINLAQQAWDAGNIPRVIELLDVHRPADDQEDLRSLEWYVMWRLCHSDLATLTEHDGPVHAVAYCPDGEILATSGEDGAVIVWDAATARRRFVLGDRRGAVFALAFSPDGRLIASAGEDSNARLWAVDSRRCVATMHGHLGDIRTIAFSPEGTAVATGGEDRTVRVWQAATGEARHVFDSLGGSVRSLAFAPDGQVLASAGEDQPIRLWNLKDKRPVREIDTRGIAIDAIVFSPDGRIIVAGGRDREIALYSTATGHQLPGAWKQRGGVCGLAFSPNGEMLVSASTDGAFTLWDMESRCEADTIYGHIAAVAAVDFAPDGKTIATASHDGTAKLWDIRQAQACYWLGEHGAAVYSAAFSPDGRLLATAGLDKTIKISDTTTRGLIRNLAGHGEAVSCVVFSPDGKTLASASEDASVIVWDSSLWNIRYRIDDCDGKVMSVAFSPDGSRLVTADAENMVKLWDVGTGRLQATFTGHTDQAMCAAFSPDGKTVASCSKDKTVKLWDAADGKVLATLRGHGGGIYRLAFSPDGKSLATAGSDEKARLWDLERFEPRFVLSGHFSDVYSVAFSPDGKTLATGSADDTIKLWDPVTGEIRTTVKAATGEVMCVAFSPDSRVLVAGCENASVLVFDGRPVKTGE
ncbi:MAG: protein kinase [Phycisphaerae bacterium]|nr:protein kinase [Phycisphaerae bacterium]